MAIRTYISGDLSTSNQYVKQRIEVVLNSQNTTNATSNITVNQYYRRTNTGYETYGTGTCYSKVAGTEYTQSVSSSQKITYASDGKGIRLFSKTFTIQHNQTTGAYTLTVQAKISISGAGLGGDYQSYTIQLPTIPRASTPETPTLTIGQDLAVTVNRATTAFTHTLTFTAGSVTKTITGVETSALFEFDSSDITALYNRQPNSNTSTYSLQCQTYNGSALVGTKTVSGTVKVDPAVASPVFGDFSFAADQVALTGDSSKIIAGVSNITITISTPASSDTGATIVNYIAANGNITVTEPYSAGTVTITLPNATSGSISVAAVDSRGNQTLVTKLGTLIAYTPPKIVSVTAQRTNSVDADVELTISGTYWDGNFGSVSNTISGSYAYKVTTSPTYGADNALTLTVSSGSFSFTGNISGDLGLDGFTVDSSFDVLVKAVDKLTTVTANAVINRGIPTLHLTQQGISVGQMMPVGVNDGAVNALAYYLNGSPLNAWEYGTWTPYLAYSDNTHGGGTYSLQDGGYLRNGDFVFAWFRIGITPTATWNTSNQLNIWGLPYSIADTIYSFPMVYSGVNVANTSEIFGYGSQGNTRIQIMNNTLGGSFASVTGSNINTTSAKYFYGSFIYRKE